MKALAETLLAFSCQQLANGQKLIANSSVRAVRFTKSANYFYCVMKDAQINILKA